MIHFYLGQPKSIKKTLSRPLHSKLKKIQGLFKDWHSDLRTFQGKMELKDFSRLCEPWGHQTSQVKLNMVLYSAWVWFLATFKSKIVQISDLRGVGISVFSTYFVSKYFNLTESPVNWFCIRIVYVFISVNLEMKRDALPRKQSTTIITQKKLAL